MKKIGIQRFVQTILATEKGKQWWGLAIAILIFPASMLLASHWISDAWGPAVLAFQLKAFFFMAGVAALGIAFPNFKNFLLEKIKKIRAFDQNLNQSQQLYLNVVVLAVFMLVFYWTGGKTLPPPLVWLFVAFCLVVALYDAYRWYRSWSEHVIGKAALSLSFATFSTLAYAIARQ